jgi:hypothetical protein
MDAYEVIQAMVAKKYGKPTMSRKAIGDFMLSDTHAVNVKSNNVDKANYSPNMISIKMMHEWVFEERKQLSFIFVDYKHGANGLEILGETDPIPIEHISWDCLTIEAQGYGVIQMCDCRKIVENQTKRDFYLGFLKAYDKFRLKELTKHEKFSARFIKDVDTINW